jgi:all-trans-8'-apo-beta-carotenal 15,15'-oxygenase
MSMATLTRNLFWGQGERDHALEVVEGRWPDDMEGSVFIVGPDKRAPGGHWFGEHGLLARIRMRPDAAGRIVVQHRRVDTPVARLRRWLPFLFTSVQFAELSPFGVTNMANTNVAAIDGRLFLGYDAGRPVEVDPETLRFLTPVGANDEWLQAAPGLLEPLCAVAAHPAPDVDEGRIYFVNYTQISPPGVAAETYLARWDLHGALQRWRVANMSAFDSIHDIKATRDHLVFCDLPFLVEPESFRGQPRTQRNQTHTTLWIVAKADLDATAPGGTVAATEVRIPTPTGHLFVDHEEVDGRIRVVLQHIPLADLMLTVDRESLDHRNGELIDPNYEGLIALGLQPSVVGRYEIDPVTGEWSGDVAVDAERSWGGMLCTTDITRPGARARQRQLWYAGVGFDPDLVPEQWWRLYGDATDGVVAPEDLPDRAVPGALTRIDLEAAKVAECFTYDAGAFPSPPTFVPRAGSDEPDDGYVVVVVHRDGPKEVQVFDANDIERGPLARATSATFNPNLMLHSCWMLDRVGPRPSSYRVPLGRDVKGAMKGIPGVLRSIGRMGRAMSRPAKAATQPPASARDPYS